MFNRPLDQKWVSRFVKRAVLETLESRQLLSATVPMATLFAVDPLSEGRTSPAASTYTPAQIRAAYGINNIKLRGVTGDGTGQTIAIVSPYDDPALVSSSASNFDSSDLHIFDEEFGIADPPSFTKIDQTSEGQPPAASTNSAEEDALDVEWSHAIAPKAKIVLIESNTSAATQLFDYGVQTATSLSGVSVVSMSFGFQESALSNVGGDTTYDGVFSTPSGHTGITFLASSGDSGAPSTYPAYSPDVLAVGGTTAKLSGDTYVSESAWSGSGGGISTVEAKPTYQSGVTQSSVFRTSPDVSFDGDPNTGVAVYDSYNGGYAGKWYQVGGTSFSTPAWAGLIAIADQGRAAAGYGTLDGPTQTLPKLYALSSSDFHDITTGNNGYAAGSGYDLATGLGTPIANLLVPALAGVSSSAPSSTGSVSGSVKVGSTGVAGETVYLDANNNSTLDTGELSTTTTSAGTFTFSNVPIGTYILRQKLPAGYTQTTPASGYGIHVTVSSGGALSNENFVDTAPTSGGSISGTVKVGSTAVSGETVYLDANNNSILDGTELHTTTTSIGTYSFSNVPAGAYVVRQELPSGYQQTTPASGYGIHITFSSGSSATNQNFVDTGSTATKLSGTVIGTAGSFGNSGNTNAKVFDGSLTTFFDGPTANGNWVGLDLGSSKTIGQIRFSPRSSYASRMIGGEFQISTTANFSSGVTTIYTINSAPSTGNLTTITLSSPVTARYIRYLSPNGSYGDIAELAFYG